MTAKEYLDQVKLINRKVALMTEKYTSMRSLLYSKSIDYSGVGKGQKKHYSSGNDIETAIVRVIDYETALKKEIGNLVSKRLEIEKNIGELIYDPIVKEIFERKYLLFQTWEKVSQSMCYSLQHIHRLHAKDLPKFNYLAEAETA